MADTDLLDYAGLKHYDSKIKACMWNWQKTKKAGEVTFKPVPESDLEPVVDFMFTETPPVEGEKGSENPGAITGATQINVGRCGKNLVKNNATQGFGIFTIDNETGVLTANGTIANSVPFQYIFPFTKPLPAGRYLLSFNNSKADSNVRCSLRTASTNWGSTDIGRDGYLDSVNKVRVVEILSGSTNAMLYLVFPAGTYEDFSVAMQLESMTSGDTPTAYEPPVRQDYTLSLGSTYYGGSLDVATGVMTVTHVAVAPAGATVDTSSAPAALPLEYADTYGREIASANGSSLSVGLSGGTVVYKLATPQIVNLTPTQIKSLPALDKYEPRINTVYTDQEAVRVGYRRFFDENRLAAIEARLDALEGN